MPFVSDAINPVAPNVHADVETTLLSHSQALNQDEKNTRFIFGLC